METGLLIMKKFNANEFSYIHEHAVGLDIYAIFHMFINFHIDVDWNILKHSENNAYNSLLNTLNMYNSVSW